MKHKQVLTIVCVIHYFIKINYYYLVTITKRLYLFDSMDGQNYFVSGSNSVSSTPPTISYAVFSRRPS